MRARGAKAVAFFGVSLLLAAIAVCGFAAPRSPAPPLPAAPVLDALTDAKVAFVDGDLGRAETLLRALSGNEAKTLLARVLLERGRADEASKLFAEVTREEPKNAEALRGLAAASQRLGRLDLAVLYWSRVTELRKDDARAWRELGLCQREKGDAFGALSSLQQSLKLDPGQSGLSSILTELATGRRPGVEGPTAGLAGPGHDAMNPMVPRPIDPNSLAPKPRVPDPSKLVPRPGEPIR